MKLVWDQTGQRFFHTGVSDVALFMMNNDGTYKTGKAWSGVTSVTQSPDGADAQNFYADNIKYLSNNYAAQKQQEIQEEQVVMMNQLGDAIQTYLEKYNAEKQYAMIITNSGGAPVITADASLDITEDVLAGLNEEYIKTKNEKK